MDEVVQLFKQNGLNVDLERKAPMHLLEPRRIPADEGFMGDLYVAFPYSGLSRSTQRRDALPFPVLLFVLRA